MYSVADHRQTWVRSLWLAHLYAGPDSVISHESAGRLHHIEEVPAGIASVMVGRDLRNGPVGLRLRRADDLLAEHVEQINGLPVTTLHRTIVDLAMTLHIASLRSLVTREITDGRVSAASLGASMDGLRRRGKPGVANLSRVLDDLGTGKGLPRSELERLLDDVIHLAGLPSPQHEYPLPGRGAVTGFVDRCWPDARLIVEADGRKWHSRRSQMERDATRSLEAQAAGFETTRLLWEHLRHDPHGTAELLRTVHEQRCLLLGQGL